MMAESQTKHPIGHANLPRPVWLCFQAALSSKAAIQANACLLAFSSFSMQQPTHMLIDPATEILGMSPIYSMDNNNMVACTARPQSANGSEPRAGRQPGSCCCVCWVGLLRRVPCRSGRAANRLMECPAQRETQQGGRPETGRPAMAMACVAAS